MMFSKKERNKVFSFKNYHFDRTNSKKGWLYPLCSLAGSLMVCMVAIYIKRYLPAWYASPFPD